MLLLPQMHDAEAAMQQGDPFNIKVDQATGGGSLQPLLLTFRPAANDHLQENAVAGLSAAGGLLSCLGRRSALD